MIRFLTAGESHGKGLSIIVEGFPSNLKLEAEFINSQLARRQMGYGRGGRMKIETDKAEILSGVRYGKTMGSPLSFFVKNKDWENWTEIMPSEPRKSHAEKITIPRPGHADLVGVSKYNLPDIRNSIDRSSARETAARVTAGSVARKYLEHFGIKLVSWVENIGGIYPKVNIIDKLFSNEISIDDINNLNEKSDSSSVRVLSQEHEDKIIRKIKRAKKQGDTLGGTFYVVATGVPLGLGSFSHYDTRISADIAHSLMSINAVKGVEIGAGINITEKFGSQVHDEIVFNEENFSRKTNFAGGLEGGITTGMPIIARVSMKPIATLMSPIGTVDLRSFEEIQARRERSDFVAVPACAVIGESMLAWTLAEYFNKKFGGDSIEETQDNYKTYTKKLVQRIRKNFK